VARGVKLGATSEAHRHKREAIKRRDQGEETLADIGQIQHQPGHDFRADGSRRANSHGRYCARAAIG
jgi:hypothetical protein